MTTEQMTRLQSLKNYGTTYEVTIRHPDGRRYRVCYCGRNSRTGLIMAARRNGARLVKLTGSEEMKTGKRSSDGVAIGDWNLNYSGRTERECITSNELEWIGAVVKV